MWLQLIFSLLLAQCLLALPARKSDETWSVEKACSEVTKSTSLKNQDDPTCSSFLYCYVSSGSATPLIKNCKPNEYFDSTTQICSSKVPNECSGGEIEPTEPPVKKTTTETNEESCQDVIQSTPMRNKNDPTCISFVYCYVTKGSATAMIKNCRANEYYDSISKVCSPTKPDDCI
ncbi:uncharacterized protein LOC108146309 [Drosophila elegans]|uniref:uncharacterized protein LOC108146309 n=1 Tax=Drosophila elegans TaxID=30023 RepID=UPI0007E774A2|nr:uncharacterized protein LOC108146309 [Drosophila elegans]